MQGIWVVVVKTGRGGCFKFFVIKNTKINVQFNISTTTNNNNKIKKEN